MERRTVLKAAVWSLPVVAVAAATPAMAASEVTICSFGGGPNDNGTAKVVLIGSDYYLVVSYKVAPDIYEANIKYGGSPADESFGTNYGSGPSRGSTNWTIKLKAPALSSTQIHSFNSHAETCLKEG